MGSLSCWLACLMARWSSPTRPAEYPHGLRQRDRAAGAPVIELLEWIQGWRAKERLQRECSRRQQATRGATHREAGLAEDRAADMVVGKKERRHCNDLFYDRAVVSDFHCELASLVELRCEIGRVDASGEGEKALCKAPVAAIRNPAPTTAGQRRRRAQEFAPQVLGHQESRDYRSGMLSPCFLISPLADALT